MRHLLNKRCRQEWKKAGRWHKCLQFSLVKIALTHEFKIFLTYFQAIQMNASSSKDINKQFSPTDFPLASVNVLKIVII